MAKFLVTQTDEDFDDLALMTGHYEITAKCSDCPWQESRSTVEEEEIDQYFKMGLRHSRMTGHVMSICRSQRWEAAPWARSNEL